jgi:hypothetical protein
MAELAISTGISRRSLLRTVGATLIVAGVTPAGVILGRGGAWAATAEILTPETFATLVQMSRDIYPHDRFEEQIYATAVETLDSAASEDAELRAMLEDGAAGLDESAGGAYRNAESTDARLAALQSIESSPFFQKVRGNLVTGLYNNHEVWAKLGYEGESASQGGYANRGFDDIDWL